MDGLGDILARKEFDIPPEVQAIKDYVRRHYSAEVSITVQPHTIIVAARSAALIGSLRINLPKLQAIADTHKRILLRIS